VEAAGGKPICGFVATVIPYGDMTPKTPEWIKDAVFYQIFPDRFARSNRAPKPAHLEPWDAPPTRFGYKGGDLYGVADRLDYLKDLGVNAIYFNPIFQSASNHRYHTQDYYQVDPLLGGNRAFDELIRQAHEKDIKVILDGVFNHSSRGMYEFQQTLENGTGSPYLDWFHFDHEKLGPGVGPAAYPSKKLEAKTVRTGRSKDAFGYAAWWDIPALPKFNTDCPEVRTFLLDVARHWIDRGIDGWRLDVPDEIDDDEFWQEFRRTVKEGNPEAYIVGEIWTEADRWLRGDQFDAVMNYVFNRLCYGFCGGKHLDTKLHQPSGHKVQHLSASQFAAGVQDLLTRYDWEIVQAQLNLISSHDEPRFLTMVGGDGEAFKLATALQFTFPGAPCIYYGDEIGLDGGHDPDCRKPMPEDEGAWDNELRDYVRKLAHLRHDLPVLRRGDFHTIAAEDAAGTFVFARSAGDDAVIIAVNSGYEPWTLDVPVAVELPKSRFEDGLSSVGRADVVESRLQGGTIPPRTACVFQ